jgi:hypothetical protein
LKARTGRFEWIPPDLKTFSTPTRPKTKVGGLMLRMAIPLFNSNSVMVYDFGFQIVAGIKEQNNRNVIPSCLIKNIRSSQCATQSRLEGKMMGVEG